MDLSISFSSFLLYLQLTCSEKFSRHSRRASTLLRPPPKVVEIAGRVSFCVSWSREKGKNPLR